MDKATFETMAHDIFAFLGKTKPSDRQIKAWFAECNHIPYDAVKHIKSELCGLDSTPFNWGKAIQGAANNWIANNRQNYQNPKDDCQDCEGTGHLIGYKTETHPVTKKPYEKSYFAACGTCNNRMGKYGSNLPTMTKAAMHRQGYHFFQAGKMVTEPIRDIEKIREKIGKVIPMERNRQAEEVPF